MIAFDITAAALAALDRADLEPVEPVAQMALAPLEALETLGFSSEASGASQKQCSWLENEINADIGCDGVGCFATPNRENIGLARRPISFTGSSGSTGITAENKGFQRGQSENRTGSTGSRNERLQPVFAAGIERLKRMRRPTSFTAAEWSATLFEAEVIFTAWADRAAALGWTYLDLFGITPGFAPFAYRGGLTIEAAREQADIIALTADSAVLRRRDGKGTRYVYRDDIPADLGPIWGGA